MWASVERPDLVRGLVLVGPFVRDIPLGLPAKLALRVGLRKPWGPAVWNAYYAKVYPGRPPADLPAHLARIGESLRRPGHWRAFVATTRTSHAPAEARLGDVRASTLVVMGERDADFPDLAAEAHLIADRLRGRVVIVPDAGHYPRRSTRDRHTAGRRVPGRGDRACLERGSREVVVAEAARVADEVGYDRLTLAAVATRLGVAVPSLYKHVDGLGELRRDLTVLALRELGVALASAVERHGVDGLRAVADAYRGYARSHPGRYASTLRAVDPHDHDADEASRDLLRTVFSMLARYGLSGDDAIDATRSLRAALHGFVSLEAVGGFGMPRDVDRSFARLVQILDTAFLEWRPERRSS